MRGCQDEGVAGRQPAVIPPDPAPAQIPNPPDLGPEVTLDGVDDAAVGYGDDGARRLAGQPFHDGSDAGLDVAFPSRDSAHSPAAPVLDRPWPPLFYLGAGEPAPFTDVALPQPGLEDHGFGIHAHRRAEDPSRGVGAAQVGGHHLGHWGGLDLQALAGFAGLGFTDRGEGRVSLTLPALLGVPRRLPMAQQQDAVHPRKVAPLAALATRVQRETRGQDLWQNRAVVTPWKPSGVSLTGTKSQIMKSTRTASVLLGAVALFGALLTFGSAPVSAKATDSYAGPYFGDGNLPPTCVNDIPVREQVRTGVASGNVCHYMRTDTYGLDLVSIFQ